MMGLTHIVVGGTAASLFLQSSDPTILLTGAIASLLPDIDVSVSPAGRVFPWMARWFEKRFPHRSCTHSLVASGAVALITYPIALYFQLPLLMIHAINIGYGFGWFADAFTRNGVEMFWPSSIRCVCPGNRNLRLRTGSQAEYGILVILITLAFIAFNMNANGGLVTQFNRFIGSTNGVQQIYNKKGADNLMVAHIKGVLTSDRSPVKGDFWIIEAVGSDLIVESKTGEIYKAGIGTDVQILTEHVAADSSAAATTQITPLNINDEEFARVLTQFNRAGAMVFVSGQITIDDPEGVRLTLDPHQFPIIKVASNTVTLNTAPLNTVISTLGNQFVTGQLSIRSINVTQTSPSVNSQSK